MSPASAVHRDQQSLDYIVRSGLAGGIAGCVAKTTVAPLDRVKILFQTSNPDYRKYAGTWAGVFRAAREIYAENGVRGLLQGHSATLVRVFPYAAIKFITYDQAHYLLMPTREQETNVRRFAAGAISGTVSVFLTYPLELIRVRMAFQTRHAGAASPSSFVSTPLRPSIIRAVSEIYHEGAPAPGPHALPASGAPTPLFARVPLLKFYRGFTLTVTGMVPYAGTSFLAWGFLRARFLPVTPSGKREKATPVADLTIGAAAGALAQTVSYPFEVVRRRIQVGGLTSPGRWLRWGETARAVWTEGVGRWDGQHARPASAVSSSFSGSSGSAAAARSAVRSATASLSALEAARRAASGARSFYVGLSIGFLKIVPMNAVSYAVWQGLKRQLGI